MTRREAIRSTAFTIIPAQLVRGYQANSKLDIGVIGIGGVGGSNARRLAELNYDDAVRGIIDRVADEYETIVHWLEIVAAARRL